MARKFATLSPDEYARLCSIDYGDLYSVKRGVIYNRVGKSLEIFAGCNIKGKLFINVLFKPGCRGTFDFDNLAGAIRWAKRHVDVVEQPKEE